MDNNSEAILSSINQSIVKDDVNLVGPIIVDQLEKSPDWADVGRQILLTAVTYRSYKITKFMVDRFLRLLSRDRRYKTVLLQRAINRSNSYVIDLFLNNDVQLISDIGQNNYDGLINDAYIKLEKFKLPELNDYQLEHLRCLKQIIKSLLQYPRNRFNEHGIVLEVDEVTLEISVSSINTLDINRLIVNNQTLLEIWINRGTQAISDGNQTSPYIRTIIFSIIKYLIKHFAKMEALLAFISPNNVQAIDSKDCYQQLKRECSSEITLMLDIGISQDIFVSIFDLLNASEDDLAEFVTRNSIRRFVLSGSFVQLFPIYGKDIVKAFVKSTNEQRRLLNSS